MFFFKQLSTFEKLTVALAIVIFAGSTAIYSFFDMLFFKPLIHPDDIIGQMQKRVGQVNRKTPDMFEYIEIYRADPLGNGDAILTGPASTSDFKLSDDSIIHVGPESLVVFRVKDGEFNIKIEKGEVSSEVSQNSKIEFQTNEKSIIIYGNEFKFLDLSYKESEGLEISKLTSTADANAIDDDEKERVLKNKVRLPAEKIANSKGVSIEKSKGLETMPEQSKEWLKSGKIRRRESSLKGPETVFKQIYQAPYPEKNKLFLHKGPAQIVLFPKNKCRQSCKVLVKIPGQSDLERSYQPDRVPILSIPIVRNFSDRIQWSIEDGPESDSGTFDVRKFSPEEFQSGLMSGKNIEVLD